MKGIFQNSQDLEKKVKDHFNIPDFLMMENAAESICNLVYKLITPDKNKKILILCGKGNNGGDGFAIARKLQENFIVKIHAIAEPKAFEAKTQFEICKKLNIDFIPANDFITECESASVLIDCLYGTGFHGSINDADKTLLSAMNKSPGIKIACDIPSALFFQADYTVTMGELKMELFSDNAKSVCGKIITAQLGISHEKFQSLSAPDAYLLEEQDITLPLRKQKSVHKGNFGHAVVLAGDKAGAAIIGATAALNFGAGYSSILKTENSNLEQFKISPELLICENNLPAKTTSIQIGSGLGNNESAIKQFEQWFHSTQNPACVIDADLFNYPDLIPLLERINSVENARIILTPHPKELQNLLEKLNLETDSKLEIAHFFFQKFKNITLVMKGANTFIASEGKIYICNLGNQSLAKAGSGDVLAGLINSLLAQGYSAKDAAITGVMTHAIVSSSDEFKDSFSLTPEKLINYINKLI